MIASSLEPVVGSLDSEISELKIDYWHPTYPNDKEKSEKPK
jgi:hypothetical protein